jgi:hypothetical protein
MNASKPNEADVVVSVLDQEVSALRAMLARPTRNTPPPAPPTATEDADEPLPPR